ncbi:hypothetical protein F5X98DRAFT_233083 [Xylaria grammica]|nr:hypothetical protein F5X98DRAFT_233083 [Xylaria grammica]
MQMPHQHSPISPPHASNSTTADLAGAAQELAETVLEKFLLTVSPLDRSGARGEGAGKRPSNSWFEKRVDVEQTLDTDDEDTVVVGSPSLTHFHLACPFYVSQKDKYNSCLTRSDLRGFEDLDRHLWTCHRQPSYCPTCHDIFSSAGDWEEHIRRRSCTSLGKPRPDGISVLQVQQLARGGDPRLSREDQWLLIWDIVFPGIRPPSLVFPRDGAEAVVWAVRDFWSAEGDQLVSDFQHQRQQHYGESNPTTLGSLALNLVIDQLVVRCRQYESATG